MRRAAYEIAVYVTLIAPWLTPALSVWMAAKGRAIRGLILSAVICLGAWVGFFGLMRAASDGKMIGGPSGAAGAALSGALLALALAIVCALMGIVWRRWRAEL